VNSRIWEFEGVTWYPTLANGLVKVPGKVDANGTVTFSEEKVIHGEATNERLGVLSGSKFVPWSCR
jgi:hypothetical protein